jgi:predicted GIY-YIG superfamily endonuclease
MSTFTLYRFFDAEDTLLYVGLTVNPGRRMEKHRGTQPWWNDVARIEMEQHQDLATLRAAEREAIEHEQPLHNVRMNAGTGSAGLVWKCEVCGLAVDDDKGYVTLDYADLAAYDAKEKEYDARREAERQASGLKLVAVSFAALIDEFPAQVHWKVLHSACDPNVDSCDYWIGVERIRTHSDLIHWSAHLFEKGWFQHTDWDDILYRHAGGAFP